jgi:7,8-dihydropterin-6-yl-methyl-4-(beta-D-ribofuranosyl)aminobenzene 5'-phosphate synthase
VYGHPDIFRERYAKPKGAGAARSIGIPFSREELESGRDGLRFRLSREPVTVAGFTLTGEVEYRNEFEPPSDRFFLDAGCTKPDDIPDDQSVFFETGGGLSVLLGCCHRGIANTLDHIRDLTGEKNFDRIIGGTHLMNAKPERVRKTIDYLQKAVGFREIVPLHCTGPQARTMFAGAFGGRYRTFSCGDTLDFS